MNRIEKLEKALESLIDFTEEQLDQNDIKENEAEPLAKAKKIVGYNKSFTEYVTAGSKEKQALENLIF